MRGSLRLTGTSIAAEIYPIFPVRWHKLVGAGLAGTDQMALAEVLRQVMVVTHGGGCRAAFRVCVTLVVGMCGGGGAASVI